VVNEVMLKPLPYRDGDRFVVLLSSTLNDPEHYGSLLSKDAETYEQRTRVFDAFGWWRESGQNLTFAGEPHHVQGVAVTTSLVGQLGVNPVFGQWFQDENGVGATFAPSNQSVTALLNRMRNVPFDGPILVDLLRISYPTCNKNDCHDQDPLSY
jgi:hypothetical protein